MSTEVFSYRTGSATQSPLRWLLAAPVVIVNLLGWKYPYLGLFVPVVMATGMVGGLFRGRYVCGNVCPRGSFLDTWFAPLAGKRRVPAWMRSKRFRTLVVTVLMGFLGWRLSLDVQDVNHWGLVFWQMCLITTMVAIVMGVTFKERAWCTICPMGTIQAAEGQGKYLLQVDEQCRACHLCENVCPMDIELVDQRCEGKMLHPDCIKCGRCQSVCPSGSLSWP